MQLLLEHGADPTAAEGGTPLVTEAAQQGHGAVAGLLEAQAALLTTSNLLSSLLTTIATNYCTSRLWRVFTTPY